MQIQQYRGGLTNTLRALESGRLTVGYIGGSITTASVPYNWPEPVSAWFNERWPGVRLIIENAGIGATGSQLAVFRAQRDLIDRGCDLVFVEFAVNDFGLESDARMRSREGLLRKLLAPGTTDVLLTYTFCQSMYDDMLADVVPATIAEFEQLGERYGCGSIWMGLAGLRDVQAGRMRWEEWLPDGIHTQYRGSLSYAQPVIEHLARSTGILPVPCGEGVPPSCRAGVSPASGGDTNVLPAQERPRGRDARATGDVHATLRPLPSPLNEKHWQGAYILDWAAVSLAGPWALKRSANLVWANQFLSTAAVGAKLSFDFEGRALCLAFDFGTNASEYRYRIDGAPPVQTCRERPDWAGANGWYRLDVLADDLPPGKHHVEIEVVHGNGPRCTGTNFHLGMIGIVP